MPGYGGERALVQAAWAGRPQEDKDGTIIVPIQWSPEQLAYFEERERAARDSVNRWAAPLHAEAAARAAADAALRTEIRQAIPPALLDELHRATEQLVTAQTEAATAAKALAAHQANAAADSSDAISAWGATLERLRLTHTTYDRRAEAAQAAYDAVLARVDDAVRVILRERDERSAHQVTTEEQEAARVKALAKARVEQAHARHAAIQRLKTALQRHGAAFVETLEAT